MMLHTKYQGTRPYGFRQEDCLLFPLYKPMLNKSPPGRSHFWPQGHNLNKLGSLVGDTSHQNIKALSLMVSDKKICSCITAISLCKPCDPWGRAITGLSGIICTNLVEVH